MRSVSPFVLTVDVGNTATNFGVFKDDASPRPKPFETWIVSTRLLTHRFAQRKIQSHLSGLGARAACRGVAVSSVVPSVHMALNKTLKAATGRTPWFVTGRNAPSVRVLSYNPDEVGADRVVNARASAALGHRPAVVVDFGTATTFDCVSRSGDYLGGVIAPGPAISAQALYERTAKLPFVKLEHPTRPLGRSTLQSIQSGLYHGYRGLVKEIVALLKKELGPRTKVITTGGQANWILKGLDIIDENIPDLTLLGLVILWRDRRKLKLEKGV